MAGGVSQYTEHALSRRTHLALAVVALGQGALLLGLAWARFSAVHQRTFDLALYARVAWGLAHGDFWSPVLNTHVFGSHLAPVLLPLGLLGRLFGTVPVLLLAQVLSIALCLWPMARMGARRCGQRGVWLGAVAWLLYPNLGHVGSYEFHPGTLAVLPLCWGLDALDRGHLKQLCLCVLGIWLCRDDYALSAAMLGVAYFGLYRDRRALGLVGASIVYFVLGVVVSVAYAPANASYSQHFGHWGATPLEMLRVFITEPERVFTHFRAPQRASYLLRVLAPLLFFSLRAPWFLAVAMPTLGINLLSAFPTAQAQYSHYLTIAVPAIVASGVIGLASVRSRFWHTFTILPLGIANIALGGLPWSRDFDRTAFLPDAQTTAAKHVLSRISDDDSVQGPDALLPHLVERKVVRRGPPPTANTRYVVLDLSHRQRFARSEDLLRTLEEPLARIWLSRPDYQLRVYHLPYALLEQGGNTRRAEGVASYFVNKIDSQVAERKLAACLSIVGMRMSINTAILTFRAHAPCPSDLALRMGATARAGRVDLLFDGALSPALLQAGDLVRSEHAFDEASARAIARHGAWLGLLRASGAPADPGDPIAVHVAP